MVARKSLYYVIFSFLLICLVTFSGCGGGDDGDTDSSSDSTSGDSSGDSSDDSSGDFSDISPEEIEIDLSDSTTITLNGDSITVDGDGVTIDGAVAVITSSGTYNITGTLSDGQIKVDIEDTSTDTDDVYLYLNNIDITSSDASPLDIESAERVVIYLSEGTLNYLTDGTTNTSVDEDNDSIDSTLYSKDDLLIAGTGSLIIDANNNNGIKSKDGLVINSGVIDITSVDDGIIGKNYIIIYDGDITVTAEGDGLKSTEDEDPEKGHIIVDDGIVDITSGADAIQVETCVWINGGEFYITSGGGSDSTLYSDETAKGIKAPDSIIIYGGEFIIDSADDSIHSNGTIEINGGTFSISSGDDAIHADSEIEINGGEINILEAYEGIESLTITINDGEIHVESEDDPINASDGSGSENQSGVYLYINGGYIYLECKNADGLDSNGAIVMTDGLVVINGPVSGGNGILDYASFTMNGGTIIGAGTSDMAQAPGGDTSTQYSLLLIFDQKTAGTLFHIETSGGTDIVTFAPVKAYASIVFSSPLLTNGETYDVYFGGSYSNGTVTDGLYEGGTYNEGTKYTTFTVSSKVTEIGSDGPSRP